MKLRMLALIWVLSNVATPACLVGMFCDPNVWWLVGGLLGTVIHLGFVLYAASGLDMAHKVMKAVHARMKAQEKPPRTIDITPREK